MAYAYITADQVKIREKLLVGHDIDDIVTTANESVESMARRKGVLNPDDIETDPVDFLIEEYAISLVCELALIANAGKNNNDLQEAVDRYWVKAMDYWSGRWMKIEAKISDDVLTGDVDNKYDLYRVREMVRGS